MTRQDAAKLMATMAVAYSRQVTDDELELWFNVCLEGADARIAGRVVRRVITEDRFWPTPARFNEVRRAVAADDEPFDRGLPAGPQTDDERANVARWIEACRGIIGQRDKRPHWHGGPEPCEVCGGMAPKPRRRVTT